MRVVHNPSSFSITYSFQSQFCLEHPHLATPSLLKLLRCLRWLTVSLSVSLFIRITHSLISTTVLLGAPPPRHTQPPQTTALPALAHWRACCARTVEGHRGDTHACAIFVRRSSGSVGTAGEQAELMYHLFELLTCTTGQDQGHNHAIKITRRGSFLICALS